MTTYYTEANYENSIIELFQNMDYDYIYGPDIERDFKSPLYDQILETNLYHINKSLPDAVINEALFKLRNFENGELSQKLHIYGISSKWHSSPIFPKR